MWADFYENDPFRFVPDSTPQEKLQLIVGGETAMWGECVDSVIFDSIVWPRAAAAAEKLWSPGNETQHATIGTGNRLAEHRCRLLARGARPAPLNDAAHSRDLIGGCMGDSD